MLIVMTEMCILRFRIFRLSYLKALDYLLRNLISQNSLMQFPINTCSNNLKKMVFISQEERSVIKAFLKGRDKGIPQGTSISLF